jgi:riboflavin synthase
MFTGIVSQRARLLERQDMAGDSRICLGVEEGFLEDSSEGDSICVSGVCLTAVELEHDRFKADVSAETLAKTTLGRWQEGREVNLELSLRAADRLGGHLVSGHVDGRAKLLSNVPDSRSRRLVFEVSAGLARYIATKGSICVDGVSLTVNDVQDLDEKNGQFSVCVIPHTLEVTTLGQLEGGEEVNLEVDLIARYLERLQMEIE